MDPISLRQSFQNANVEALREAQGFNDLLAREAASRKDLQERVAEEQAKAEADAQALLEAGKECAVSETNCKAHCAKGEGRY